MKNKKLEINIVYAPQKGPPTLIYENVHGKIWNSKSYDPGKLNVGMGWYSIKKPKPHDSILVVEPCCILPTDYNVNFNKKFKHIFTWATKAMNSAMIKSKVVAINHPTYHKIPNFDNLHEQWKPWTERNDEIVIIANNKSSQHHSELYSLRTFIADVLHVYSPYKVSWYGQIPLKKPYYRGKAKNKFEILKNAKFSLCTENSYHPKFTHNYFTEKMPDVWAAGAVPIYMGCFNIDSFGLPTGSYIDLRNLVEKKGKSWRLRKQALNNKIVHFNKKQYENYVNNVRNIFKSGKLEQYHSYDRVYEIIIKTFLRDFQRENKA